MRRYEILDDAAAVASRAEALLLPVLTQSLVERQRADLVLAGGSTPKRLYEQLARATTGLAWRDVHLWFGDERTVPPDHADSNYGMVQRALLERLSTPPHVHRLAGELAPARAAADYEALLVSHARTPRFDVVLLGMGADGHTASLFPGTTLVDEREHLVGAAWVEKLGTFRLSLTVPTLCDASLVLFLVVGEDKADRVRSILLEQQPFPAAAIDASPPGAETVWLLDRAAASKLG